MGYEVIMSNKFHKLSDDCILNLEDVSYIRIKEINRDCYIAVGIKHQSKISEVILKTTSLEECQRVLSDFDHSMNIQLQVKSTIAGKDRS